MTKSDHRSAALEALLELLPDPAAVAKLEDGTVFEANRSFLSIADLSREQAIGRKLHQLEVFAGTDESPQYAWNAFVKGLGGKATRVGQQGDQDTLWLLFTGTRIDAGGRKALLVTGKDVSSFVANYRELQHKVSTDSLTGILNRRAFRARLEEILAIRSSIDASLAVVFVDLDRFKPINDHLGHAVGDRLLIAVAARLSNFWEGRGEVARLGGDEFAGVITGYESFEELREICTELTGVFEPEFEVDGIPIPQSVSIGAVAGGDHIDSADDFLDLADKAMYQAKEHEGTAYHILAPSFRPEVAISGNLGEPPVARYPIEIGQLRLLYSPMMNIKTRAIVGAEVLLQWEQPTGALLSGHKLWEEAIRQGRVNDLTCWLFEEGCEWIQSVQGSAPGGVRSFWGSLNLSVGQYRDPKLSDRLAEVIDSASLSKANLSIEVPESGVMTGRAELTRFIEGRARLTIDNFGSGYTSLNYLRKVDLHAIKPHASFVQGIGDKADRVIVQTVGMLGSHLELVVMAEGVASEEQLSILESMGYGIAQGPYVGEPVTSEAMVETITASRDQ